MGQVENIVELVQKLLAAVGVVFASNVTVTAFGEMVPLNGSSEIVAYLITSGIAYKFLQAVLNDLDKQNGTSTKSKSTALGDRVMPW